jgi:hypothetical protein
MVLTLLLMAGCGLQQGGEGTSRSDRSMLQATEMQATGYSDLFQVIQTLRPQWLRLQGATSFRGQEEILVYLDGNRMGGVETLRQIAPSSVSSAQFLSGLEATQRWGLGHGMGAIVISTR